jgi:hypothetical protein
MLIHQSPRYLGTMKQLLQKLITGIKASKQVGQTYGITKDYFKDFALVYIGHKKDC